jgi:hypothetical protein
LCFESSKGSERGGSLFALDDGFGGSIGLQRHQGQDLHFNSRSGLLTHSF